MGLLVQAAEPGRPTSNPAWRLLLLGAWQLSGGDVVVDVSSNAQRLLALLALRGVCERSYVAGLMWPDCSDLHAQGNLRATLSRLHRRNHRELLQVSNGTLALNDAVHVDVRRLVRTASAAIDGTLDARYWQALSILSGQDLLIGWYDEWVLTDRDQIRQLRLHALEALSGHLLTIGDVATGLEAALEAVSAEPLRESAHRAVIRAHLAEGNRVEALRQLAHLRRLLHDELGIAPSSLAIKLFRDEGRP